jgi:hypothetical protein
MDACVVYGTTPAELRYPSGFGLSGTREIERELGSKREIV